VTVAVLGLVAAVAGSTAVAVHHLDQTEIKRIQDKAATEIKRIHDKATADVARVEGERKSEVARVEGERKSEVARVEGERKSEVARVEGERRLSEERLRAEVERYKYDLRLTQTQDFEPYQAAIRENPIKRGGAGGPQD
jgi:cell division septum initiation protein DivIVA